MSLLSPSVLSGVICTEFSNTFGRGRTFGDPDKPIEAMFVEFRLHANYAVEDGYRHVTLAIVPLTNYVLVAYKEWGDVAPLPEYEEEPDVDESDVSDDMDEGDLEYEHYDTGWKFVTYHDSCWREGVEGVVNQFADKVYALCGPKHMSQWYDREVLSEEEIQMFTGIMTR